MTLGLMDRAGRHRHARIGLHALARHGGHDLTIAADIDVHGVFLSRQVFLQQVGSVLRKRVELFPLRDLLGTPRTRAPARLDDARERRRSRRDLGRQRFELGNRRCPLHPLEQLVLVPAGTQTLLGGDRQHDAPGLELAAPLGDRHELRIHRGKQQLDPALPAGLEQDRDQARIVAARDHQALFCRNQVEARGAGIHVGHVELMLARQALPDADGRRSAGTGDEDAHRVVSRSSRFLSYRPCIRRRCRVSSARPAGARSASARP